MAARNSPPCPTPPHLTNHAAERWDERVTSNDIGIDPWTAWIDGVPIDLPDPWGLQGDEARYHRETQVILCRRGRALPTVYDVTGPDAHPEVRRAVEHQLQIDLSQEAHR